jgi:hypothetical protein
VKTHTHLLVRDALSAIFVAAAGGDARALLALEALGRVARGEPGGAALEDLCTEDGEPLFAGDSLGPRFAAFEAYARDRARRYEAAVQWIEGEQAAGDPLECARAAWDAGLFFEVHELLEPAWLAAEHGPARDRLQGLIMAGAAMHHLCEGNRAGARGLLRDASRRLRAAGEEHGYGWGAFAAELARLAGAIDRGELPGIEELREVPRLERS